MAGAHSTTEAEFLAANGATAVQADSVAAGRGAPTGRYKVTIVNCHPGDQTTPANGRLAIGTSQAGAQAAHPWVVEADYGEKELFVDGNVAVWVRPMGTNDIYVRIIQWSLA